MFLDEREQAAAEAFLAARRAAFKFFGGFPAAERRVLGVFPGGEPPLDSSFPISGFSAVTASGESLRHQDFLGAVLALGIRRESVGDIVVNEDTAYFAVLSSVSAAVERDLSRVSRESVRLLLAELSAVLCEQRFEEYELSVSSMRLDCVVAALAKCSREGAAEKIAAGLVKLCALPESKGTKAVRDGDTVSIRGLGRFMVLTDNETTRRGRIRIHIKRYA